MQREPTESQLNQSDPLKQDLRKYWREVYRADEPTPLEVDAAYRRYQKRRDVSRKLGLSGMFWNFSIGAALAVLALLMLELFEGDSSGERATSHAAPPVALQSPAPATAESIPTAVAERAQEQPAQTPGSEHAAYIQRDGERLPVQPGVQYRVAEGQQVLVMLGDQQRRVDGPQWLEFQLAPEQASGWRMLLGGARKPAVREAAPQPEPKLWTEAAQAMRQGNAAAAESAFQRLMQREQPTTRDAAALALAQLWQAQGDSRARPVLQRLSRVGATELIRQRAQQLLDPEN